MTRDLKHLALLMVSVCVFVLSLAVIVERHSIADTDFVYFYSLGQIANHYSPEKIYDYQTLAKTLGEVHHIRINGAFTSGYPPFIPLLFRPFALLPLEAAYYAWQFCTLFLLLSGLAVLAARLYPRQYGLHASILASAVLYLPFLADTLMNGQLAAIGVFALCLALSEQHSSHLFRSGLALSLALYKPTLLVLLIPMLLFRKQLRILAGLVTGGLGLMSFSAAFTGIKVWSVYFQRLPSVGTFHGLRNTAKYVDAFAFSTLLFRNQTIVKDIALVLAFGVAGLLLVRAWFRAPDSRPVWAATITWTLFLNLYVPIYDTVLLIPSIACSAPRLIALSKRSFWGAIVFLFCCSWVTETFAQVTGLQILSLAIVLLGAMQLRACLAVPAERERPTRSFQRHTNLSAPLETVSPAPEC